MGPVTPTDFTPWLSLFGGVLIGLSAVIVMGAFGKIAGISGITKGLVGMVPGLTTGNFPVQTIPTNLVGMAIAGLLVGVGTALGSGCTSGHGVCGLARLSPRSLVAVLTFVAAAVVTTTLVRHIF